MTVDALDLLSGDAQTFLDKVWASHVHVHRADPAALEQVLSLDDADQLVTSAGLRTPALRLAKDGGVLPTGSYTRSASLAGQSLSGLVDPRKVLTLFDEGATVVLQGLHRYWTPVTRLVRGLERALGHPCQANAYLTPPSAQGFALHSDSHDVFVFQTHGTKQWEVHDGDEARTVLMEPGTSMYLPTGTPHAARAQDTASLHVTVGINQVTWRQLLTRLTAEVLSDEAYDARIPAGYLDRPDVLARAVSERLGGLAGALTARDPEAVAEDQVARFLTGRNPALRGALTDRATVATIGSGTRLVRREGSACVLVPGTEELRVLLGDREVRMPPKVLPAMRLVAERAELRPAELPGLDPEGRLVLARRLVREGLLRVQA